MLIVNRRISIPVKEFDFAFARSSGPGGQHVNKVNTKVTLTWLVAASPSVPEDVKQRFANRYARRINKKGELLVTSQRYRDQGRNVADCLEKLRGMLSEVAVPQKTRKPTKPTRGSKERRLAEKRRQSDKKRTRSRPVRDDS